MLRRNCKSKTGTKFPTSRWRRKWNLRKHFSALSHEIHCFLPSLADHSKVDLSCSILAEVFLPYRSQCILRAQISSFRVRLLEGMNVPELKNKAAAKWVVPLACRGQWFPRKPTRRHSIFLFFRVICFTSFVYYIWKTNRNISLCSRPRNKRQYFNMLKEFCQPVISINPSQLLETMYSAVVKRYSQYTDIH